MLVECVNAERTEKWVRSGDLELWAEAIGNPHHPAVLLIAGAGAQGIYWPNYFCEKLVEAGLYVIRYDHRDTGLSSTVDYALRPYSLEHMADDALAVLDGFSLQCAHIVGTSMGGYIAQSLAIDYPERVKTLSSLMSTAAQSVFMSAYFQKEPGDVDLPGPSQELLDFLHSLHANKFQSVEDRALYLTELWKILNGNKAEFDFEEVCQWHQLAILRAHSQTASFQHNFACEASLDRVDRLHRITAPTLVVHGQQDPALPLPHGMATAKGIGAAELVIVPELGHLLTRFVAHRIASLVIWHCTRQHNVGYRLSSQTVY